MSKPIVLMPVPLPAYLRERMSADFELVASCDDRDADATIDRVASNVRFIATGVPVIADGVSRPIDATFMARFPGLQVVANMGVGYDNIDAAAAAARGVIVTNTPDVLTEETADAAFGLLLCVIRRLPQADRFVRDGEWPNGNFPLSASLRDRRMGIVGLGRIGKAIARRGEAFGLEIMYHGRREQSDVAWRFFADLIDMASACDILMICAPGGPATQSLVNARVLGALGSNGVVVNIARGGIVDEEALIAALEDGRILGAGLDVFADEPVVPPKLIASEKVVLLPHVGSATSPTRDAMARLVVDNLRSFARGEGPLTPVAETPWPRSIKRVS